MKLSILSVLVAACCVMHTQTTEPPKIRYENGFGQLIVHGKPFFILGGELGNSPAGTSAQADAILPRLASMHTIWVGSWATAQQIPEPANALAPDDLRDATLRQIIHTTISGQTIRVRLSNVFGTAPLHLTSVHIARALSSSSPNIDPETDKAFTFHGMPDVTIPAGADFFSDPLNYGVPGLASVAISIHYDQPPPQQTSHPGSRATSYVAHGDLVASPNMPDAKKVDHWYQLSGLDVLTSPDAAAVITLGDSITDGHGATTNGNDRWPDVLAQRLHDAQRTRNVAVLNEGIGGNRILLDSAGPNALARFDRDVLAQSGARYLIVLEGVNDLGMLGRKEQLNESERPALLQQLLGAYEQMIVRAHSHGIKVYGATITPYVGSGFYHPGTADEAGRQSINQWIRTSGHFDAVIDFDAIVRDPAHPDRLLPQYDCGDHLHPSPAGYAAMANAIPLTLFTGSEGGR